MPICSVCNEAPRSKPEGHWACACGTPWTVAENVTGSAETMALLESHGFGLVEAHKYYFRPKGNVILTLYSDGTWDADYAPSGLTSLMAFLDYVEERVPLAGK